MHTQSNNHDSVVIYRISLASQSIAFYYLKKYFSLASYHQNSQNLVALQNLVLNYCWEYTFYHGTMKNSHQWMMTIFLLRLPSWSCELPSQLNTTPPRSNCLTLHLLMYPLWLSITLRTNSSTHSSPRIYILIAVGFGYTGTKCQ